MIKKALSNMQILKGTTEEVKILYLYRYISLAATSIFYLAGNYQITIGKKLIAIGCLSVASVVLNYLYIKNQTTKSTVILLIIIEIVGNMLILIPTGGINSPYIWYSLNTVLVTMYYFDAFYCFLNVIVYLTFTTIISSYIFDDNKFLHTFLNQSNLFLCYILITAAIQFLFTLTKKLNKQSSNLEETNSQLIEANAMLNESMEHIMSLYQAVYSFKNTSNKGKLIYVLTQHAKEITKTPFAFFCTPIDGGKWDTEISGNSSLEGKEELLTSLKHVWENIRKTDIPVNVQIGNKQCLVVAIKSIRSVYGLLGIEINYREDGIIYMEKESQLKFLSSLSVITFERLELEEINEHLVITQEQKRIADEIHDSTSQRLFAIACMVNTLIKKPERIGFEKPNEELYLIRDSLNKAIKELRETIYDLSWKNKGISAFQSDVENYINDISKLYKVNISLSITGNQDLLYCDVKKTIFSMICESTGNAVRHGKCKNIIINFDIKKDYINLIIQDDGSGFDIKGKIAGKNMGLGIKNISNYVYLLNGEINIDSAEGRGTNISIKLPNKISAPNDQREVV